MEHNICTHITVNYTDTHEDWADSFYRSGNTGKSHNPNICFLLFLFLFVTLFTIISFLGHNRNNRMHYNTRLYFSILTASHLRVYD